MKAIAIVELPDDAFDDGKKWIIDDEGSIRYMEDNAWMHYANVDGIELRPLPEPMTWGHSSEYIEGYNAYREEITGETQDVTDGCPCPFESELNCLHCEETGETE